MIEVGPHIHNVIQRIKIAKEKKGGWVEGKGERYLSCQT